MEKSFFREQISIAHYFEVFSVCAFDGANSSQRRVELIPTRSNSVTEQITTDFQALSVNQNLNLDGMGTWFSPGKLQIVFSSLDFGVGDFD